MTVTELLERLRACPPGFEVVINDTGEHLSVTEVTTLTFFDQVAIS